MCGNVVNTRNMFLAVAARSKAQFCGYSRAEIVGSNPTGGMVVCCVCCVLSGRGLSDELITRLKESYRLWCVIVCDLQTSWIRRPWPTGGLSRQKQTIKQTNKQTNTAECQNTVWVSNFRCASPLAIDRQMRTEYLRHMDLCNSCGQAALFSHFALGSDLVTQKRREYSGVLQTDKSHRNMYMLFYELT